jgi:glyoxylase-like metal-dependent hydrolase (beta-lactamase superfamily II)
MFKPALLSAALATAISAHAAPLKLDVFNPGEAAIFPVASVIVSGAKDAVLIDAQFSRGEALKLVEQIRASGKHLTTVYISNDDPDYYFGLDVIHAAFPDAKIVALPDVIAGIEAQESRQGRLLGAYPERQRTAASNRAAAAERQRHHAGRPEAEHHA